MTNITDEDCVRLGANLAGWISNDEDGAYFEIPCSGWSLYIADIDTGVPKFFTDALAFQLRDQINAIDGCAMVIGPRLVLIESRYDSFRHEGSTALDWIKCIVDSGLLTGEKND